MTSPKNSLKRAGSPLSADSYISAAISAADDPDIFSAYYVDPGGTRGIAPLVYMQEIEERTGRFMTDLYDLGAGTSTGLLAVALAHAPDPEYPHKSRYAAEFGVEAYQNFADLTFPPTRFALLRQLFSEAKYDARQYEAKLDEIFGDLRVRDLRGSVMLYVTDASTKKTICIRNIRDKDGNVIDEHLSSMRVADVLRGGTTAPTYHKVRYFDIDPGNPAAGRISLMDAGNAGGNVGHEVLTTLRKIAPWNARCTLTHFGTGYGKYEMTDNENNWRGLVGYFVNKVKREHYLTWTFNSAINATVDFMKRVLGEDFFSFNAFIDRHDPQHPSLALDNGDFENMSRHRQRAREELAEKDVDLERLCKTLLQRVWQRTPPVAPEKSGVQWKAPERGGELLQGMRELGQGLVGHVRRAIGMQPPNGEDARSDNDNAPPAPGRKASP